MSACFMPLCIYNDLADPASGLSLTVAAANVDVLRSIDTSQDFAALPIVPANIPAADETWLAQTAFENAQSMIDRCANPAYTSLFTVDEAVLDICADIGSIDLTSARVDSITYYTSDDLVLAFQFPPFNSNRVLFEKYYAPQLGAISVQNKLNACGARMVAASAICAVSDIRAAAGGFTSCVVILKTGCACDIAVSFSMVEENIVAIDVKPIPAE